jgi:hypothetical protein
MTVEIETGVCWCAKVAQSSIVSTRTRQQPGTCKASSVLQYLQCNEISASFSCQDAKVDIETSKGEGRLAAYSGQNTAITGNTPLSSRGRAGSSLTGRHSFGQRTSHSCVQCTEQTYSTQYTLYPYCRRRGCGIQCTVIVLALSRTTSGVVLLETLVAM